ncbi:sulfhydryl oxidase 2 isoform X2 [Nicotiana tabacum]|uniref:Sulfhydryl oxidase n=1 Tax=Nicotiana tabacum TaxID=4097 RepID=A0A1S4B7P5_TOBAC|nr:PREDICTED: sulfhydryl oxidase 2-like isoform X1 [Nicotiana tabacum]XP_016484872.1 PREDICTED: sulfhydryl oxidase 2-like isoform X1 [Nicotiana tabacum]
MSWSIFMLFLATFISSLEQSVSISAGSQRAILRAISNNQDGEKPDFGVELNATNFDTVLKDTPAPYAIVEFFAHWCPACRNYKPHYEKVARLFNGADASHPGIILMTRVDCALTINSNLCDKFSVKHYPMLLWGPPKKFVGSGWDPKQENSEIRSIENGRTADILLGWINKQLGSSYGFDDGKYENEHLQKNFSDPAQIATAIYDVEEATSTAFGIILDHKMIRSGTRASLIKFLQLLVAHHPSKRCRKGSADILVDFDNLCPSEILSVNNEEADSCSKKGALGNYQICGKEVPRGYWMYCRGSKNDTRGFSCGLWVLLHSLSIRVEDGESNMAFRTTCDFIHNFFICEECRQHFYDMCSSVPNPFKKARDYALWLWRAHNKVNERLKKDEASLGTGDPEFPKVIWPSKQLCPSCYLNPGEKSKENSKIEWNEDEVFKFLVSYYGKELVNLYKEKELQAVGGTEKTVNEELVASTNAVVVPLGAALAIAVASCAFGALACFWRSQQKNRKYKYLHSLKNI